MTGYIFVIDDIISAMYIFHRQFFHWYLSLLDYGSILHNLTHYSILRKPKEGVDVYSGIIDVLRPIMPCPAYKSYHYQYLYDFHMTSIDDNDCNT